MDGDLVLQRYVPTYGWRTGLLGVCRDVPTLCHAEPGVLAGWLEHQRAPAKLASCLIWLVLGSGAYGASIGLWRAPLQSVYGGLKLPLLILLTTGLNGLLNGILAQLLGAKIPFRQSLLMVLMSFAMLSLTLGSLTPLSLYLTYSLPPMGTEGAAHAHRVALMVHTCLIGFSGTLATVRLYGLLRHVCGDPRVARRILCAWLTGNMFLGCQLSWNLRPFFGTPSLEVTFLRADSFDGSFYEAVFRIVTGWLGL
ncbi:hypothetical protein ACFL59_06245 [Planctomycetota bacterium]